MNFFKALFGGQEETPEEKREADEARDFDMFKYDGVKAAKMGRHDYAVKCYREALKLKEDPEVRDYLAQSLIRTGCLTEAYEQLQKLAEAAPEAQPVLVEMATVAHMMEDYLAMGSACEKALLLDDKNPQAYYLYAQACIGQDNDVDAVAMLTKALTLKPDYADARLLRGKTLLRTGQLEHAHDDAACLVADHPDSEDALLLAARVAHAMSQDDEALTLYNKVIEANPFVIEAYRERSSLRDAAGDTAGAKADADYADELQAQAPGQDEGSVADKVRQAYKNNDAFGVFE